MNHPKENINDVTPEEKERAIKQYQRQRLLIDLQQLSRELFPVESEKRELLEDILIESVEEVLEKNEQKEN